MEDRGHSTFPQHVMLPWLFYCGPRHLLSSHQCHRVLASSRKLTSLKCSLDRHTTPGGRFDQPVIKPVDKIRSFLVVIPEPSSQRSWQTLHDCLIPDRNCCCITTGVILGSHFQFTVTGLRKTLASVVITIPWNAHHKLPGVNAQFDVVGETC